MARARTPITVAVTDDDTAAPVIEAQPSPHLDALLAKARAEGLGCLREVEALVADVKKDLRLE